MVVRRRSCMRISPAADRLFARILHRGMPLPLCTHRRHRSTRITCTCPVCGQTSEYQQMTAVSAIWGVFPSRAPQVCFGVLSSGACSSTTNLPGSLTILPELTSWGYPGSSRSMRNCTPSKLMPSRSRSDDVTIRFTTMLSYGTR